MEQRYSWKQMPEVYHASYYNDIDIKAKGIFVVVDKVTGKSYLFPKKFTNEGIFIDDELWNQEIFNWACSTAPDFCIRVPKEFLTKELIEICLNNTSYPEFIKRVPNLTRNQCEKFVKRFPTAIKYVPNEFKSPEMAKEVLKDYPELLIYFPINYVDDTTRSECYTHVSFEYKVLFIEKGYMDKTIGGTLLSSQMLMDLIDEFLRAGYKYKKLLNSIPWSKIPKNLFTEEICLKLVKNEASCISIIPQNFYKMAVKHNLKTLKYLDDNFKTSEMCLEAVTFYPELINEVPPNILNEQFLLDLQAKEVPILGKNKNYIDECLRLNQLMNGVINLDFQKEILEQLYNEIPQEIKNININNLSIYFSIPALKQITNLGELFVRGKTLEFINYFKSLEVYNEVINTIGLLRCKYFGEKPVISINAEKFKQNEEANFYCSLGLSKRCTSSLIRSNFCSSSKEFFTKIEELDIEDKLGKMRNLGEKGINEILVKANIIIRFYHLNDKKIIASNLKDDTEENSLNSSEFEELYKELQSLREERAKLDSEIDMVLEKIQRKLQNKNESGVAKLELSKN